MIDIFFINPYLGSLVLIISAIFTWFIVAKMYLVFNRYLLEAKAKNQKLSAFEILKRRTVKILESYENGDKYSGFYSRARRTVKQSGYHSKFAAVIYIIFQFVIPIMVLLVFSLTQFPDVVPGIAMGVLTFLGVRICIIGARKEVESDYKRHAYKIYRYIHNQLAAGCDIHVAIKSLYLTGEGTKLSKPLTELSARYGRTLDIDESISAFKEYFKLDQVYSLCVALEQGVKTGDAVKLIARQEKTMFREYFNYVQADTDNRKKKQRIVIVILALIICTIIILPMFVDLGTAKNNIFGN